jgi:hypothetical protein
MTIAKGAKGFLPQAPLLLPASFLSKHSINKLIQVGMTG